MVGVSEEVVISFTHPWLLLLLIPTVVLLWQAYKAMRGFAKHRKMISTVVRFVVASLLIFALAGPEAHTQNEGTTTIFVLDRSDSISDSDRQKQLTFLNEALPALGANDECVVILAGKVPQPETASTKLRSLDRVLGVIDGTATNISAAIRLALASFPDSKGKRIVLLTDGNETAGDARDSAAVAASEGVAIDFVPLGTMKREGEVALLEAELPTEVRAGQPFSLRVHAISDQSGPAVVEIMRDGVVLEERKVNLNEGKNTFVLDQKLTDPSFYRYKVSIRSAFDKDPRNNFSNGFVSVRSKPKILVLQGDTGKQELVNSLRKQNIDVDLYGPEGAPIRPEQAYVYDAILLNDINAATLTPQQMKILQSSARDGGVGLGMVGGEDSFLPGGWYGTPVAEALPVDMNIRQRKSFPSTSILIICDTSGSMGMIEDGVPKVRLAAKAAEETVKLLSPLDRVGVVASTDGIEFVAPMQPLTNKANVISQIQRLGVGGGGIYCLPSMEFAEKVLMAEQTKVRHLILLGDGSDCDSQDGCFAIAQRMRANKITTSTVSIGIGPHSPFLKLLAASGGGNYYPATKASQLPAIFTQDAAVMSRSAIEEGAFFPKLNLGDPALRGIDSTPALFGYCLADSRPLSQVGMRSQKDDVILASWQYGLGTTLAFTSDAKSQWARNWMGWQGFSQFWAQAVRSITRRNTSTKYEVKSQASGGGQKISIIGKDSNGVPVNEPPSEIRMTSPDGKSVPLKMAQVGPGEFEATISADQIGSYMVTVAEKSINGIRTSTSGFSVAYPLEYRFTRTNEPLLAEIAETTGGQMLSFPKDAVRSAAEPGYSVRELWTSFLLLSALLFLVDITVRRVAVPMREIVASATRLFERKPKAVPESPEHLERLSAVKSGIKIVGKPGPVPASVDSTDGAEPAAGSESSDNYHTPSQPAVIDSANVKQPKSNERPAESSVGSKLLEAKRQRKK